jgi:polyhydroxyalkanoic acid synthase PhaR subunit
MELWRNWLTETERQWNGFFNQVMGTDSFGRVAGSYLDGYAVLQRALNQGMERYLNTFNLPTHSDIVELGERLLNIEERLASIESNINNLYAERGISPSAAVTQLRPARTRRPRNQNSGSN